MNASPDLIKEPTEEEKQVAILRLKTGLENARDVINTLEIDLDSKELMVQTSALWITGHLLDTFTQFMNGLRVLQDKNNFEKLQADIKLAAEKQQGEIGEQVQN